MNFFKKGQSTFEYLAVFAAAVVVLLIFLNPNGPFRNKVEGLLNQSVDQMNSMVDGINLAQ